MSELTLVMEGGEVRLMEGDVVLTTDPTHIAPTVFCWQHRQLGHRYVITMQQVGWLQVECECGARS